MRRTVHLPGPEGLTHPALRAGCMQQPAHKELDTEQVASGPRVSRLSTWHKVCNGLAFTLHICLSGCKAGKLCGTKQAN